MYGIDDWLEAAYEDRTELPHDVDDIYYREEDGDFE
ncbi:hypothetical protein SEA_LILYPAD_42 [Gordonia phage LilyPad]|nr:hypothetical protein SEA_LILYPAD_42 [Gordonia phage LilyPad]